MFRAALSLVAVAIPLLAQSQDIDTMPPLIIAANADSGERELRITGEKPIAADITLGLLATNGKPDQRIVPSPEIVDITSTDNKNWSVKIRLGNLVPFGDSTIPVMIRGQPYRTFRIHKAGLIARASDEGGFSLKEGRELVVVLENPTAFTYKNVRLRLRVQDIDACQATVDKHSAAQTGDNKACDNPAQWAAFSIPAHAPVTLRVKPPAGWFTDARTGLAPTAKRKGALTLQFVGESQTPANTPPIYEQAIPLEIQFEPGILTKARSFLIVFLLLFLGAIAALILRVAVPNYRRKKTYKEQLGALANATRAISGDVDSKLRVLLRVERLSIDQLRKIAYIAGPSFDEFGVRIEKGLASLQRKVEFTRRIDVALGRRSALQDQDVPPSRLEGIDRHLEDACQLLTRDQLEDQDWVSLKQRLDAANKLLDEPSQEDNDAFEARLVQRWKAISTFFGRSGALELPKIVEEMTTAFPQAHARPQASDNDGSQWIKTIGITQADLQIGALEILRDFSLLVPTKGTDLKWDVARTTVAQLLSSPSAEDLAKARLRLRQLAEGIDVDQIKDALSAGQAYIEITPQSVRANERVRLQLRFRNPALDTAAARREVRCEWKVTSGGNTDTEHGWEIYRYFEDSRLKNFINVIVYYNGAAVTSASGRASQGKEDVATAKTEDSPKIGAQQSAWKRILLRFRRGQHNVEPNEDTGSAKKTDPYNQTVALTKRGKDWGGKFEKWTPEALQLLAALFIPLGALAIAQTNEVSSGGWLELAGVGFTSETIRGILTGKQETGARQP